MADVIAAYEKDSNLQPIDHLRLWHDLKATAAAAAAAKVGEAYEQSSAVYHLSNAAFQTSGSCQAVVVTCSLTAVREVNVFITVQYLTYRPGMWAHTVRILTV